MYYTNKRTTQSLGLARILDILMGALLDLNPDSDHKEGIVPSGILLINEPFLVGMFLGILSRKERMSCPKRII